MADTTFEKFLYELKQNNDIVDVIGDFLEVKQKGRTYWVCCPFHNETDPSMSISREKQMFYCFGCKESGDVIKFISKYKGLEFMEAIKYLATRARMEIPSWTSETPEGKQNNDTKKRLALICKETAYFYHNNLLKDGAKPYIDYLAKRGVGAELTKKFGLGVSLDWDGLVKHLKSKGYAEEEIIKCGVVSKSEKGNLFDSLGERLIFPIINYLGEVIAFGGRTLNKEVMAKYKNTCQTPIFDKSKALYNINLVKKLKIRDNNNSIIIVEGYMDTVALVGAGIENVVASMGTSLTIEQARLIKRYAENVYICYDGDSAGQNATLRGLDILENEGLSVKVITMPSGLDPDEVIKAYGKDGYLKYLKSAKPLVQYKLDKIIGSYDLESIDEKHKCVQKCLNVIKKLSTKTLQEEYLKLVRDKTGVSFETLYSDLDSIKYEPRLNQAQSLQKISTNKKLYRPIRFILGCMLFNFQFAKNASEHLEGFLTSDAHINIYKYICENKHQGCNIEQLREILQKEYLEELQNIEDEVALSQLDEDEKLKYYEDCERMLINESINDKINMLNISIANCSDDRQKTMMHKQLTEFINMKKNIRN